MEKDKAKRCIAEKFALKYKKIKYHTPNFIFVENFKCEYKIF